MRRVLVTGATGTIGAQLVGRLRERGVPVRAFVRDAGKAGALLGDDVELALGDFAAPATLRAALDGITDVFLATPNHPEQLAHETAVIDAAAAAGVPRLVKLSAIGAQVGSPLASGTATGAASSTCTARGSRRSCCARASTCRTCSPPPARYARPAACSRRHRERASP